MEDSVQVSDNTNAGKKYCPSCTRLVSLKRFTKSPEICNQCLVFDMAACAAISQMNSEWQAASLMNSERELVGTVNRS